jgi:hypothetical protein
MLSKHENKQIIGLNYYCTQSLITNFTIVSEHVIPISGNSEFHLAATQTVSTVVTIYSSAEGLRILEFAGFILSSFQHYT